MHHMPDYVVQRATGLLNRDRKAVNGSTVLLLGLAYDKNSSGDRTSPSVREEYERVRHRPRRARCSGCGRTHVLDLSEAMAGWMGQGWTG